MTEVTELSVTQEVSVAFGSMAPNEVHGAEISLDVLSIIPGLKEHRTRFACAVLDRSATHMTVDEFAGSGTETALSVTTQFRATSESAWSPLSLFEGFAEPQEMLEAQARIDSEQDAALLASLLLQEEPSLGLRVEAMSARELDQLSLFLEIGLYFSTQESDCAARDGVAR